MNENNPLIFGKKKYQKTKPINSGMSTFWKLLVILALGLSAVSFALSIINDGKTGLRGPAGADGAIGPAGVGGADGTIGPAGVGGADGTIGPVGADGADGAIGPAGADGAIGPACAVGPHS